MFSLQYNRHYLHPGPVLPPTTLIDEAASSSNATTTTAVATATAAAQLIGLRRGRNQKLI